MTKYLSGFEFEKWRKDQRKNFNIVIFLYVKIKELFTIVNY